MLLRWPPPAQLAPASSSARELRPEVADASPLLSSALPPAVYRALAAAVLLLAAFNLGFRLDRESVGEWDESLYATSAWEMTQSGRLIGTTFDGALDYYNAKPPLTVWIIAATFKALGVSLLSLRVGSAVAAWLTVWLLQRWARRVFGPSVALAASAVLASLSAFLHQHSGRSGNPDALLTLLVLVVVVVLWSGWTQPSRLVWLGPALAGVFLLKGTAVALPLVIVAGMELMARPRPASRGRAFALAALILVTVAGTWAGARYAVDGWTFFDALLADGTGTTLTSLEGHRNGPFYYLAVLQRYHYEWLVAAALALLLVGNPARWGEAIARRVRGHDPLSALLLAWGVATLIVPSVMRTRLMWYLNPFYPFFALLVGVVIVRASEARPGVRARVLAPIVALVLALIVAEGKTIWRLYRVTNLDASVQGLLLDHARPNIRVYRDHIVRSEAFVVRAIVGAGFQVIDGLDGAPTASAPGDLVVVRTGALARAEGLRHLGDADGHSVYVVE